MMGKLHRSFEDRFWENVDKNGPTPKHCPELGPCWIWKGGRKEGPDSYGRVSVGGGKQELAHRVAYRLKHGPIPRGKWVLHRCDNRPCVRDEHHFLGTVDSNNADMKAKGRYRVPVCKAKLTAAKKDEIRRLYATGQWSQPQLARRYGVSQPAICQIVKRGGMNV